jgi:hypothetical protein
MSAASARAWESALVLLDHDLILAQRIACEIAAIAGPDRASLSIIALAAQILGARR